LGASHFPRRWFGRAPEKREHVFTVGSTAAKNRLCFGGQSQGIVSVVYCSLEFFCIRFTDFQTELIHGIGAEPASSLNGDISLVYFHSSGGFFQLGSS
jgi:hypothetical protein